MPGQDRTGPMGQGPKTGRGKGSCGKANSSRNGSGCRRNGGNRGAGRGSGRGGGQGRGRS